MKKIRILSIMLWSLLGLIAVTGFFGHCSPISRPSYASSPLSQKGQWGQIRVIAQHPNLYYNQSEIDELRDMILRRKSPPTIVDIYNQHIKDATAIKPPNPYPKSWPDSLNQGRPVSQQNMKAALSYMIEPSQTKAQAIRTALQGFMQTFPNGMNGGFDYGMTGPSAAFMFDVAYNSPVFSIQDKQAIEAWFQQSAQAGMRIATDRSTKGWKIQRTGVSSYEGKQLTTYVNWWAMMMSSSLAMALVSKDQAAVEFWADSGWPHDMLTVEGASPTWPPLTANLYDLTMYLLSVLPSGAHLETYSRASWDPDTRTFVALSNIYQGGPKVIYHIAWMHPILMAAEGAYHNGFNAYAVKSSSDPLPAIQRYLRFNYGLRGATHREDNTPADADSGCLIGYNLIHWYGYRRYDDPVLEKAALESTCYGGGFAGGPAGPAEILPFFGYPRRFATGPSASSSSSPSVTPTSP
jgi:hypothetical protein